MAALTLPNYRVEDLEGHAVEAKIEDLGANFEYDLPKDKFRQARIARQVRVTVPVHLALSLGQPSNCLKENKNTVTVFTKKWSD